MGEVSKSLLLQEKRESTVYTSKVQERKTLGGLTRGGRWAERKKPMCTDTLPWQLRSGLFLLYVYFLYIKHTKTEKKMLENKSHPQSHHTEETINIGESINIGKKYYFLLFMLISPGKYTCMTALPTSTSGT